MSVFPLELEFLLQAEHFLTLYCAPCNSSLVQVSHAGFRYRDRESQCKTIIVCSLILPVLGECMFGVIILLKILSMAKT